MSIYINIIFQLIIIIMERKEESGQINNSFLGKKTKKAHKLEDNYKSDDTDISSVLMDTIAEISSDNLISLEEKSEINGKIPGFDDLKIPSFFNDYKMNKTVNKTIKDYNKMKAVLGSPELAQLYLIDINRIIYGEKRNCLQVYN